MENPLLSLPDAVRADGPDTGVAAHYGDPLGEQRALARSAGLVDRSHRGILRITGPDRLSWLHSLTTQQVEKLAAGVVAEGLILSPNGHIEHHLAMADDGTTTWIHVEPGTAGPLLEFLESMRFMLRVEVTDVSAEYGLLTLMGPDAPDPAGQQTAMVMPGVPGTDLAVARDRIPAVAATLRDSGAAMAGMWAYEALRIAAHQPRLG
ncbi:MAG: YgfZ/GcvT domain-containing protein, partial [Streptosporangiaceae bacterium]